MTTENEITALGEFNKKFENLRIIQENLENDEEVASFAVCQNGEVLVNLMAAIGIVIKKKWDQNTIVNITN